jgi:hypothetical protein
MAMGFRNGQENCNASRMLRRFKNGIATEKRASKDSKLNAIFEE